MATQVLNKKVSIIIPMYNASKTISSAIESVFFNTNYLLEVVVVDDGSNDGSGDLVKRNFPHVHVIRTENRGVSAARNLGIQESSGEYIVFLDADDLLVGDKIERQSRISVESEADVVYGDWQKLIQDPEGNWIKGPKVQRSLSEKPDLDFFTDFWCPTGSYLFKRSIVDKVGGFRLDLPVIQDARFALDCALADAKFVHDPEISCLYRVHKTGSVSTQSQFKFASDCLRNAQQIVKIFGEKGFANSECHQKAIGQVANFCANNFVGTDYKTEFNQSCELFMSAGKKNQLYLPWFVKYLSFFIGYRKSLIAKKNISYLISKFNWRNKN
jgi:glycosyltransferase involved in cell wall biosynthesis